MTVIERFRNSSIILFFQPGCSPCTIVKPFTLGRTGVLHLNACKTISELPVRSSLLLKDQWRTANAVDYEINRYLNAIGNLDERNAAIHTVVLSIKSHCPGNLPMAGPLARTSQMQCFVLR